jgi:hypothetical protein
LLLTLSLGTALAEGWLLYVHDGTDGALMLLSSRRWMERHVRYDRHTYRNGGEDPDRPAALRILALGDSVVFGHGIAREEDRFPDRVEELLRRRGVDAAVVNISAPGWDTRNELAALAEYLDQGRPAPQVVLLGYVLNDHAHYVDDPELREVFRRMNSPPPPVRFLLDRSCLFGLIRHLWLARTDPALGRMDTILAEAYRKPLVWRHHLADLAALSSLCRTRGILLHVVIFPFLHRPWEEYPFGEVHADLASFWRGEGALVTDLLEEYRRHPLAELVVGRLDRHPNPLAHRLAAQEVLRELQRVFF